MDGRRNGLAQSRRAAVESLRVYPADYFLPIALQKAAAN